MLKTPAKNWKKNIPEEHRLLRHPHAYLHQERHLKKFLNRTLTTNFA